jgi:hypothetical protein
VDGLSTHVHVRSLSTTTTTLRCLLLILHTHTHTHTTFPSLIDVDLLTNANTHYLTQTYRTPLKQQDSTERSHEKGAARIVERFYY